MSANGKGHACPICGKTVFPVHDSYEICEECGWEDDWYQEAYPTEDSGANEMNLLEYKAAYEHGWRPDWLLEMKRASCKGGTA